MRDRCVAGMWCSEVLAELSDYVDGDLPPVRVAQINAHLRECDVCERFGGEFAGMVQALRAQLTAPPPDPAEGKRLMQWLRRTMGSSD